MSVEKLIAAADRVDVIDVAGRVIAAPRRNAVSVTAAEALALCHATERFWAVALEADLLVRALKIPITGNDETDHTRDHAIQTQMAMVSSLMAAIRGEQENEHV
ncbi:hypothetical protein [Aliihoeflea sp. PC F10.4]